MMNNKNRFAFKAKEEIAADTESNNRASWREVEDGNDRIKASNDRTADTNAARARRVREVSEETLEQAKASMPPRIAPPAPPRDSDADGGGFSKGVAESFQTDQRLAGDSQASSNGAADNMADGGMVGGPPVRKHLHYAKDPKRQQFPHRKGHTR